jgi:alkylation response protein AidB-like acyl-CoA dehydrogenase
MFRSEPGSERHRGLSMILVPLHSEGITVRPIRQLDGETGFAEVFLDGVRVPVENTLGGEGQGWSVAMSTAGFERGLLLRAPGRFLAAAQRLLDLYQRTKDDSPASLRDDVIRSWMETEAYRLHAFWTVSRLAAGATIGAEASMTKVFWSEMDLRLHETALQLRGPDAEFTIDDSSGNEWIDGFLFSLAGPIYAGTNEIQRNVIAERVLGLPRSR